MSLHELRKQIDELDRQLWSLLDQRASLAVRIGGLKRAGRLQPCNHEREQQVLQNIEALNANGALGQASIKAIYQEIIVACRSLQQQLRVGYLGPVGTFSHVAAISHFGKHALLKPYHNLAAAFNDADHGQLDYVVAPLENSSEGVVGQTLDLLSSHELNVLHQFSMFIQQSLLARVDDLRHIAKVASHPQALAQARGWLSLNLPTAELVPTASSGAAAIMAQTDTSLAVIGPAQLAAMYDMHILAENIEDNQHNQTLFIVLGKGLGQKTGSDRTMLWFAAPHHSGSLYQCLKPLAEYGVNLTRLHSRPGFNGPWQYQFYLEMEGHYDDENVSQGIASLKQHSEKCVLIGSYQYAGLAAAESRRPCP